MKRRSGMGDRHCPHLHHTSIFIVWHKEFYRVFVLSFITRRN
jgi:hypothetical protein